MSDTVIKIENLSKIYRLGEIGTGTLSHDLNRWWQMNIRGKDDPYALVGGVNDRTAKARKGEHVAALKDINLEVKQGEVLGIIGKNGAGKSTLLKVLSRVTSPTTGSISVKGRLASLLEVGTGFHPEMTGRENIYMNGTIMGMRKWEISRKLDEIVEFAGVAKYLDTPVKRYSSGMKVRLGFAVAAHLEPEILVVDEVLAVGDAEFQKKAIGKMQDVSTNDGRTVLFVSHNMASVKSLCTRGVLLENGKLSFSGNIEDVIENYINYSEEPITTALLDRKDREGNQKAKFANITMDYNGSNTNQLLTQSSNVNFKVEIESKENFDDIGLILSIHNKDGIILYQTNTAITSSEKFELKEGLNEFICHFDNIPLQVGTYSISGAIDAKGIINNERLDLVRKAFFFDIIQDNIYGTGKTIGKHIGFLLLKNKWKQCKK